jgi:hypothetical protein
MVVVEKLAFAVASAAMGGLAAVFVALVAGAAAPEPEVGPEGRVPVWIEQERGAYWVSLGGGGMIPCRM